MAAIKALEQWCKIHCEGYRDVLVTNMTTSFRSGMAFCALINKHRPDLIDYDSLRKEDVFENNRLAFQVAEEKLGIPALLDAEDMVALRIPDRLSILTYVSQYYNYFNGRPPIGGVKRPAEDSKEEPSEKKNLPVVAKTFVPKTAMENRLPSAAAAQTSPRMSRASAQKAILVENANKTGTLNSRCVACKSHVHLVQRHFVEGKLYHRSCFRCCECSSVVHGGGYDPGKTTDAFLCDAHQNSRKPSEPSVENERFTSAGLLDHAGPIQPAPLGHRSSVLSAPLNVPVKPASPAAPSQSWTASAQKTQSDRQRFFQAARPVAAASTANRKLTDLSSALGRPKVTLSDEVERRAKTTIRKKLAEGNGNNNNSNNRRFTIRSAENRFGDEPGSSGSAGWREHKCSQGPAGNRAGLPSSSRTNNTDLPCLRAVGEDDARPPTGPPAAKDPGYDWPAKLTPHPEVGLEDAKSLTEPREAGLVSSASSPVSIGAGGPLGPTLSVDPVSSALSDPEQRRDVSPRTPQLDSGNLDFKHEIRSPVRSPPRGPSVESVGSSVTSPSDHGRPSGAKKGKYLSPTSAPAAEMRSPSVKSRHIPVEQIETELIDIQTSLAQLEKAGVELERKLRSCEEEGDGDVLMDPLMVDWFNLIRRKQTYFRKESELVYIARTQELERQQPGVEGQLRRLLEKPDHLKSREEQQEEKKLLERLMDIVDGRNAIVENLDEDRLREVEEDQQLNEMMKDLGVKKPKAKRKPSISKLFRRRRKRRVE
ncbi:MICAL-like protein 2a [Brachionichthys hirsutus]|uniref:MICAL-like protein 2a n=1 Tax=Brachionichthys hirsutus TaxID=412623 RepID=UPI003604C2F2